MSNIENMQYSDSDGETSDDYKILLDNIGGEFKEFSNMPFNISCIDNIEELDKPFFDSTENLIIIKDDRCFGWCFENLPEDEKNKLLNYTKIYKRPDAFYISLRDVLEGMLRDKHYKNEYMVQDDHRFLEGWDKVDEVNFTVFFGS